MGRMKNALQQAATDAINLHLTINLSPGERPTDESSTPGVQDPYQIQGRPVDDPLYHAVCDTLGLDDSEGQEDEKKVTAIIEMVSKKVGNDPEAILKFLQKAMHEISGGNKHKQLYRILRME